jgi:hypothetical protein
MCTGRDSLRAVLRRVSEVVAAGEGHGVAVIDN